MKKSLLFVAALLVSAWSFAAITITAETNKAFTTQYEKEKIDDVNVDKERVFTVDGVEFGQIAVKANGKDEPAALKPIVSKQVIIMRKVDSGENPVPAGALYNKTAIDNLNTIAITQYNDKKFKVFAGNAADALAEIAAPISTEDVKVSYIATKDGEETTSTEVDAKKFVFNLKGNKFFKIEDADSNTVILFSIVIDDTASAIDNAVVAPKAVKVIENGQLVIIRDGVRYNTVGQVIE